MPKIVIVTNIAAPLERCFDLARSVEAHQHSMAHTAEHAIAGRTSGLFELGDTVTWQARHFGIMQRLTARITEYQRPQRFVDEMVHGAFESFVHVHEFFPQAGGTRMIDTFNYTAPLGVLGRLADVLFCIATCTGCCTIAAYSSNSSPKALEMEGVCISYASA